MKMKKYTADTMVQAMQQVRADFGDDAVILSSSIVHSKGFLGLFRKKQVEVVAGFDEPPAAAAAVAGEAVQPAAVSDPALQELKHDMREMKLMLKAAKEASPLNHYPESMQPIIDRLTAQELKPELVRSAADRLFDRMKEEKADFPMSEQLSIIEGILKEELADLPFGGIPLKKKYVNVLGPTGVGKTTTIAKIAARSLIEHKRKVGFITTDTYRIAAIEQLRTYANLLQAPVEVAYTASDFKEALRKLDDKDLIFIDTAGRNYKEQKFIDDLNDLIDFDLEMESYLVLAATTKESDMHAIADQFRAFPIDQFIFTKLDETESVGPVFNMLCDHQKGIAYMTDGQEVPEDLEEATVGKLLTRLLKEGPDA